MDLMINKKNLFVWTQIVLKSSFNLLKILQNIFNYSSSPKKQI